MKKNFHKQNSNAKRPLRLETLESREMLSAVPLSAAEYADLRAQYAEFKLSENMADMNVITLDLAGGDGLAELKAAITEAGTTPQSDLIVVRTTETANTLTYTAQTDELTININAKQYGSVTIVGLDTNSFTLDADQKCRVMTISGNSTIVNIGNLTITKGNSQNSKSSSGGGIYNTGTLVLSNSTLTENIAFYSDGPAYGGGIYNSGTLTLTNTTLSNNKAAAPYNQSSFGGGIYNDYGMLTITNSTISGNTASVYNASNSNCRSYAGGIYNLRGTVVVVNSTLAENSATAYYSYGGGIYNGCGTLTVTNSTISGNTVKSSLGSSYAEAGGIYNDDFSTLTITNSIISENSSGYGGGIYNYESTLTIINSIIFGNSADKDCGGIYNPKGELTITNCTLSGNTSCGICYGYAGKVTVNNSIIVDQIIKGSSQTRSITGSNNLSTYTGWTSGSNNYVYYSSKPLFVDTANNDYHLTIDSQAIDKGSNLLAVDKSGSPLVYDLDGKNRIMKGTVDIGAYEFQVEQISAPTLNEPTVNENTVSVSWNAIENASGYQLEYKLSTDTDWVTETLSDISGTFIGFPGKTYNVRVKAIASGTYADSDYSAGQTVSIPVAYSTEETASLCNFLEQTDSFGVKNGAKLNPSYSGSDPSTWIGITWAEIDGTMQAVKIDWSDKRLTGTLDISSFLYLTDLDLRENSISALTFTKDTVLTNLQYTAGSKSSMTLNVSEWSVKTAPTNGTVQSENGKLVYTPNSDFAGTDSFVLGFDSSEKTLAVMIEVPNRDPVAVDDSFTNNRQSFLILDVLANDSDPDGDVLSIVSVTQPTHGQVAVFTDGNILYTPTGSAMNDSFTYTISDGHGGTNTATVTITAPANEQPVAQDDTIQANRNRQTLIDVLANDSDPDGDPLTVSIATEPEHGNVQVLASGKILYTSTDGVFPDSFTYTISDGFGGTSTATVTITAPSNEQPVAVDDSARVELNGHVVVDVLANDSDPDGDALSILSVEQPVNGSVVLTKDDKILYLPKTGFSGTDSFMYTVSDGHGGTAEAVVNVEVIRTFKPLIVAESGVSLEKISEWEVFNVALLNGEGLAETQTVSLAWDASLFELNVAQAASESGVSVELGAAVTENGITTQEVVLNVENPAALTENDLLASLEFVPIAADSLKAGDSSDWTITVNREALNVAVESFAYDLNDSGSVEINDLVAFARVFNQSSAESETARIADFDGSGTVEINDLVLFARNFGKSRPTKPAAAALPMYTSSTKKLEDLPTTTRGNVTDAAMAAYWDETK